MRNPGGGGNCGGDSQEKRQLQEAVRRAAGRGVEREALPEEGLRLGGEGGRDGPRPTTSGDGGIPQWSHGGGWLWGGTLDWDEKLPAKPPQC